MYPTVTDRLGVMKAVQHPSSMYPAVADCLVVNHPVVVKAVQHPSSMYPAVADCLGVTKATQAPSYLLSPLDSKSFAEISAVSAPHSFLHTNAEGAALLVQTVWRGRRQRLRLCAICYSKCRPVDMVSMGSKATKRTDLVTRKTRQLHTFCGHHFCNDCATEYLTRAIRDGKVYDALTCPEDGCSAVVSPLIVDKLCDDATCELYCRVGTAKTLTAKSPLGRYCPHCSEYVERHDNSSRKVECKRCDKSFCARCSKPYHVLTSCKDVSFKIWSTFKNVKRCPRCDFYIEKNGGCQHMSCGQCSYNFCWSCMSSQADCDNIFCKGNIMNHSIFGSSKPVRYATRGVAGAVVLPIVVAGVAVAGTAFVTFKTGELTHKKYKKRQRRKKRKKAEKARKLKNEELKVAGDGKHSKVRRTLSSKCCSTKDGKTNELKLSLLAAGLTGEAKTIVKMERSPVVDTDISLVLLEKQLRILERQVAAQLPEAGPSVKWGFVQAVFLKELKRCKTLHSNMLSNMLKLKVSSRVSATKRLLDDTYVSIGTLMLQLRNVCMDLADIYDDDALNPTTTFRYQKSSDTYTPIVKTDVTKLFSEIQEMLPNHLDSIKAFRNYQHQKKLRMKMFQQLLVGSGASPSAYVLQLLMKFEPDQRCVERIVFYWLKAIRNDIEGDCLEWLATESWLYKMSIASCMWEQRELEIITQNGLCPVFSSYSQNHARFCIGAITFHYQDLVAMCMCKTSKHNNGKSRRRAMKEGTVNLQNNGNIDVDVDPDIIDLFDVEDLVQESQILLPTVQQLEQTIKRPFALGCMLQYLTSRHQSTFTFQIRTEKKSSSAPLYKKGLTASYNNDIVLETLHCALSLIYDSSLLPFLRAMCFNYISLVFRQMELEAAVLAFRTPSTTLQKLTWEQLIKKVAEACLAVMLHKSTSPTSMATEAWMLSSDPTSNDGATDTWMLPSACGCFHSIFANARTLMYHLTPINNEMGISGTQKSPHSSLRKSWARESTQMRQIEENEARDNLLNVLGKMAAKSQLCLLNGALKKCSTSCGNTDKAWVFRSACECLPRLCMDQEWLVMEKNGVKYYVSFGGEVRTTLPESYTVVWEFAAGDGSWIQNNAWVKKKFPMLRPAYYLRSSQLR